MVLQKKAILIHFSFEELDFLNENEHHVFGTAINDMERKGVEPPKEINLAIFDTISTEKAFIQNFEKTTKIAQPLLEKYIKQYDIAKVFFKNFVYNDKVYNEDYEKVDVKSEFVGGYLKFNEFLEENQLLLSETKTKKIEYTVYYIIEKNGTISINGIYNHNKFEYHKVAINEIENLSDAEQKIVNVFKVLKFKPAIKKGIVIRTRGKKTLYY